MSKPRWFIFFDSSTGATTLTRRLDDVPELEPAATFRATVTEASVFHRGFLAGFNLALDIDVDGTTPRAKAAA